MCQKLGVEIKIKIYQKAEEKGKSNKHRPASIAAEKFLKTAKKAHGAKYLPRIDTLSRVINYAKESVQEKNPSHLHFDLELDKITMPEGFFL